MSSSRHEENFGFSGRQRYDFIRELPDAISAFHENTTGADMELVGQILSAIGGLGSVVCFILVVVRMIQKGAVGLGIACIALR